VKAGVRRHDRPGGVTAIAPDGSTTEYVDVPDEALVTNICFATRTPAGDADPDRRTAYITAASSGRLVATTWPRPGLALPH
jgi:gluconolactonase